MTHSKTTALDAWCPTDMIPYLNLLAAMMHRVILDVRGEISPACNGGEEYRLQKEVLQRQARAYALSIMSGDWSFDWLCDELNIDAIWLKEEIRSNRIMEWPGSANSNKHLSDFNLRLKSEGSTCAFAMNMQRASNRERMAKCT